MKNLQLNSLIKQLAKTEQGRQELYEIIKETLVNLKEQEEQDFVNDLERIYK